MFANKQIWRRFESNKVHIYNFAVEIFYYTFKKKIQIQQAVFWFARTNFMTLCFHIRLDQWEKLFCYTTKSYQAFLNIVVSYLAWPSASTWLLSAKHYSKFSIFSKDTSIVDSVPTRLLLRISLSKYNNWPISVAASYLSLFVASILKELRNCISCIIHV